MVRTKEAEIADRIAAERARLLKEAGLEKEVEHFRRPVERPFTANQRGQTTILISGLTIKHEELVLGCMEGLGYRCDRLPTPDVRSFELGKEYGNNGQCNPTYFTVGNLVKHLQKLREEGTPKERIDEDFVYLTAGGCGPCRFGMYEAEYRLALRNAGFPNFRVILFDQAGGLSQGQVEAGLKMDLDFFLTLVSALGIGDLLNEIGYQIRPYEVEEGATDRALKECTKIMRAALRDRSFDWTRRAAVRRLGRIPLLGGVVTTTTRFLQYLLTRHFTDALEECRRRLAAVEVDRTRVKAKVKVTGEFWAQTTEGDGNYRMFRFLEGEGAEALVEPIMTWLMYLMWQVKQKQRHAYGSKGNRNPFTHALRVGRIVLAEKLLGYTYNRFRRALGGTTHPLACQMHLQRTGHPYYNSNAEGGEGHLEVAKNIYYSNKNLAHMVLSLKPFGCMPSTQSDGAQAAVVAHFPQMIYLPIETSGEGEINAHSRVQMALGEARRKCKEEFAQALESTGRTLEDIQAWVADRPELRSGIHAFDHDGCAGTAAAFVKHVAGLMEHAR